MEIGILILIILGSFIFKKGKSNEESPQKPVPSKEWKNTMGLHCHGIQRNL